MSDLLVLMRYSLRKLRGPAIALWVLLFGLQMLMTMIARTFEMSGQFSQMASFIPEFIRPMLDPTFMTALSFSGMVCFGYTHVIVIMLLTAQSIVAGTEPVGEIESKFVDLLAARPIPRRLLIMRSVAMILFLTVTSVAVMVAGSLTGLTLLLPEGTEGPPLTVILSLALNLALLVAAWGAISLCFSAFTNRRAVAASVAGLVAFAAFIIDFTGRLWEPVDRLAAYSPFRYYAPFPLIVGEPLPWRQLAVLVAIFVVATGIAMLAYQRRDL